MANPTYFDWLTLIAIVAGPLAGIWVTRLIDERKSRGDRRWAIFESLIKTRGLELSPEHVSNLNMIPLMFPKEPAVTAAHSQLMQALNDPALGSDTDLISEPVFLRVKNARQDLITAVGRAVKANLPDGVLERLGYAPSAWATEYQEGQRLRRDMIDVLNGRKAMQMIAGIWEIPQPSSPPSTQQSPLEGANEPPPSLAGSDKG